MAISSVMSEALISAGNAMKMAEIRQGLNKELGKIETLSDMNNDLRSASEEDLKERRAEKKRTEKAAEKKRTEKEESEHRLEKASDKKEDEASLKEGTQETGSVNIVADGITPETGVVGSVGTKVDVKT